MTINNYHTIKNNKKHFYFMNMFILNGILNKLI